MQIELQEFPSSAGTPNKYGAGLQGEVTKSVQLHALESAFNFPCAKGFFTVCGSKLCGSKLHGSLPPPPASPTVGFTYHLSLAYAAHEQQHRHRLTALDDGKLFS